MLLARVAERSLIQVNLKLNYGKKKTPEAIKRNRRQKYKQGNEEKPVLILGQTEGGKNYMKNL